MRTASTRFVIARVIFQRRNTRATHACRPPRCPSATREERAREGRGERRGGGRCAGRNTGRGAGPGLRGPGGARPPRPATTAAAAVFAQLALRWGRNWAAQWHLAWAVGKRFRGCRAKRLCVHSCRTSRFQSRSSWLLQRSRQLALWSSPCSSVFGLSLSGVPRALAGQLAARLGVSRATRTARVRPADEADANNIRGRVIHEQTCAKEVPIPLMAIR